MRWLRSHLYAILAGIKVVLLTLAYTKGRKDADTKRAARDAGDYHDTRTRIDQVVRDNDGADVTDWLRERGKR
jgi:hypothetical protein